MNIFITSKASEVLESILTYLPKNPEEMSVAFISNAADIYDEKPWLKVDWDKLIELGFHVEDIDLRDIRGEVLREKLNQKDIIFVAGGNTSYLLEKAQESGFLEIARDMVKNGTIYIGSSAGSLLAAKNIELDQIFDDGKFGKTLKSYEALGIIDFVPLPHANKERYQPYHDKVVEKYGGKYDIRKINDDEMIVVTDSSTDKISSKEIA